MPQKRHLYKSLMLYKGFGARYHGRMWQKGFSFIIVLVFLAVFPGNTQEKSGEKDMPSFFALLNAAEGSDAVWRPDWPVDMPPDLFVTAVPALSIIAELEDGTRLEYSKDSDGRVRSFPLLLRASGNTGEAAPAAPAAAKAAAAGTPAAAPAAGTADTASDASADTEDVTFLQGRCEYDRQGRLLKLFWKGTGEESDAEVLQWDDKNRPLLWRIWSGDYYFAVLDYSADILVETWYKRDGTALFIIITENGKQQKISDNPDDTEETVFYYNSWGLISGIDTPDGKSVSGLYNDRGMPGYLKKSGAVSTGDAEAASVDGQNFVFTWDGTGKLVRLIGEGQDSRYEYILDSRGNWTTRKELSMKALGPEDGGRLVPVDERSISRRIRYGEGNR